MKLYSIQHEFVDDIPDELEDGKLYVSIPYRTASHLCACGCGQRVVTPIKPPKWHLTFDGDTVSLSPSVGNWQFPCRSHYWIRNNRVEWAKGWTDDEIEAGRARDADDVRRYYTGRLSPTESDQPADDRVSDHGRPLGLVARIMRRVRGGLGKR